MKNNMKNNRCKEINNKYFNAKWTVWLHRIEETSWKEDSYKYLHTIDTINTFWDFFTYFNEYDKVNNYFFIMRNKIKPIWEDNENRNCTICSIKIFNVYNNNTNLEFGTELMIMLTLSIINETLIMNNEIINGITYGVKKNCVLIKIWFKGEEKDLTLSKELINKIEENYKQLNNNRNIDKYKLLKFSKIESENTD